MIKITPRALPPGQLVSKINNNLPRFAKKARFLPVSSFNTAAIKRITRNTMKNTVSYTGIKYSEKSNRLKGKILNRNSEFDQPFLDLDRGFEKIAIQGTKFCTLSYQL